MIKRLVVLAVLVGGGYYGYRRFVHVSPAAAAYKLFADALGRNRFDEAAKLASADVAAQIQRLAEQARRPIGPDLGKIYGGAASLRTTASGMTDEIAGTVSSTRQKVVSETRDKDGTVHLRAVSSICRDPPGCTGMRCTTCVDYPQTVDVCADGNVYRVCAFAQEEPAR